MVSSVTGNYVTRKCVYFYPDTFADFWEFILVFKNELECILHVNVIQRTRDENAFHNNSEKNRKNAYQRKEITCIYVVQQRSWFEKKEKKIIHMFI